MEAIWATELHRDAYYFVYHVCISFGFHFSSSHSVSNVSLHDGHKTTFMYCTEWHKSDLLLVKHASFLLTCYSPCDSTILFHWFISFCHVLLFTNIFKIDIILSLVNYRTSQTLHFRTLMCKSMQINKKYTSRLCTSLITQNFSS